MRFLWPLWALIFSTSLWSQDDWRAISPLDYCPEFQIEFQTTSDGEYKLQIPSPAGPRAVEQKLENINDLSSLTDLLVEESAKVCGDGMAVLKIEPEKIYFEQRSQGLPNRVCQSPLVYSEPYLDLAREMVAILQFNGNRCDQMMAYTELQTKITQLSDEDLIQLKEPGGLFHRAITWFTGSETDRMIKMYNTCGGKKFTDKFIANLILLEAKNSCAMPKPPGMFSFQEAKDLAQEVAKNYDNMSIMDLNDKKSEITKRATQSLALAGLKSQVTELLGPQVRDIDGFISELKAVQDLNSADFEDLDPEYLSLGFVMDATMEVAQKAAPIIARSSFEQMLPPDWDETKKNEFLDKTLEPKINDAYARCMSPYYDKSAAEQGLRQRLASRKSLKKSYCQEHPSQCHGKSCDEKINLLSGDPSIEDSKVVQACVMKAVLTGGVRPLIGELISGQKENLKDMFELTPELSRNFSDKTYEQLLSCANKKLGSAQAGSSTNYPDPANPPILTDLRLLQQTSPTEFEKTLKSCANVAQAEVAKDFFALALAEQDAFAQAYKSSEGATDRQTMEREIQNILASAYNPCVIKQENARPTAGSDPMLCVPAVEIAAASNVIQGQISQIFSAAGAKDTPEASLALKEFEDCAQAARDSAQSALLAANGEHPTPINTPEDANDYLDNNNEFYSCAKKAVSAAVAVVGSETFDQSAREMEAQLQNPEYMRRLKNGAVAAAQICFDQKLAQQKNWREFTAFNEAGGLEQAKEECAQAAMDYTLPKVLMKETAEQMASLNEDNFIQGPGQVGDILAATAFELRRKYDLELPAGIKGDAVVEWSFAQAHNLHSSSPNHNTESFVKEYSEIAMDHAVNSIHTNIKNAVLALPGAQAHAPFFEALSPQCLSKAYSQYSEEISNFTGGQNAPSEADKEPLLDMFAKTMLKGLEYQRGLGPQSYREKIRDIKNVCDNLEEKKDIESLLRSGAFDFMIKSSVQHIVDENFQKTALEQCSTDLANELPQSAFKDLIQQACAAQDSEGIRRAFARLSSQIISMKDEVNYEKAMRNLAFIKNRHLEMNDLIRSKLQDPKYIDRTIFAGSPSPVLGTVYSNLSGVVQNDPQTMKELSLQVTRYLMFQNGTSTSFGEGLVKAQIQAGFGMSGYDQAREAITEEAVEGALGWKDIIVNKDKVIRVGREGLEEKWTPAGIEEFISWDTINQRQKDSLVQNVYESAIARTVSGEEMDAEAIAQRISDHAMGYKHPDSGKTIADRITDHISDYVGDRKMEVLGFGN